MVSIDEIVERFAFEKNEQDMEAFELMKLGAQYIEEGDETKAFTYFKKAADLGSTDALYYVSIFYRLGKGITQDDAEYKRYLTLAAKTGHSKAANELSHLEKRLNL